MSDQIQTLEEKMAHLQKTSDELSDVLARQETEIARLTKRVEMLMQREAEREIDETGSAPIGDRQPPHW